MNEKRFKQTAILKVPFYSLLSFPFGVTFLLSGYRQSPSTPWIKAVADIQMLFQPVLYPVGQNQFFT